MTIHKSQGLTFERTIIDLGKSKIPLGGITFVALSRLITLEGLYLKPFHKSRLSEITSKFMIR